MEEFELLSPSEMNKKETDESEEEFDPFDHEYVVSELVIPDSLYQGDRCVSCVGLMAVNGDSHLLQH